MSGRIFDERMTEMDAKNKFGDLSNLKAVSFKWISKVGMIHTTLRTLFQDNGKDRVFMLKIGKTTEVDDETIKYEMEKDMSPVRNSQYK